MAAANGLSLIHISQEGMEAILPDSMENGENQGDAGNAGAMNVME